MRRSTLLLNIVWGALGIVLFVFTFSSCSDTSTSPNDIGGDVNLDLTTPGSKFPVSMSIDGVYDPHFESFDDSTVVLSRDNGIVSFKGVYAFDSAFIKAVDTLLGLQALPASLKLQAIDGYLKRYGAVLDTTDKNHMKITANFKVKITSDGIAEFFSSKGDVSRARTVIKYDWNVGDSYTFTDDYGVEIKRTVVSKSVVDDYQVAFWKLKVIQVDQTMTNDPLISSIRFVGNHKYGLVGIKVTSKNGKTMNLTVFPPTL